MTKDKEKSNNTPSPDTNSGGLSKSRFYDSFFIDEFGKLENARSERYGMPYSIALLHVDSFDHGKAKPGKKELRNFMEQVAHPIAQSLRNCDVGGLFEKGRILLILPQTDYLGSLIAIKKLTRALVPYTTEGEPYASVLVSQATYPKDAVGFNKLIEVAKERLSGIKESPWETLDVKKKLFWEVVAKFTEGGLNGNDYSSFDVGEHTSIPVSFIDTINAALLDELSLSPEKRGILYISAGALHEGVRTREALSSLAKSSTKVFIVGEDAHASEGIKNATAITLTDQRLGGGGFTFYLSEDSAYAVISKEAWGETHMCFHTSDPYVVEGLVTKFQRDFHLQEQL